MHLVKKINQQSQEQSQGSQTHAEQSIFVKGTTTITHRILFYSKIKNN